MHSPRVHADPTRHLQRRRFCRLVWRRPIRLDAWPWQLTVTRRSRTVQPIQGYPALLSSSIQ